MTDMMIAVCIALVVGLWLGFLLAVVLTWGSFRKWRACGNAYKSGRVAVLHELYDRIAERQMQTKGAEWSILNDVLDLITGMLPKEVGE